MSSDFPVFACPYSKKLAEESAAFRLQVYDEGELVADKFNYGVDPFGELSHASKCFGLKQRFPDRVLIMTSDKCFMNCRHCTRRGLLGKAEVVESDKQLSACISYVKARSEVRDVLLSGGDLLTLSDEKVEWFVDAFAALPQIDLIRVCTRALCTNPERITDNLVQKLSSSKKVWVNTQFNSAEELTDEAVAAASKLVDKGIPVSCQTVLLKGVNDTGEKMLALFKALTKARIRPYYVFMCDPVAGIERFRVPLEKAKEIEEYCSERIGGLALPKFVADLPGRSRKMPIDKL